MVKYERRYLDRLDIPNAKIEYKLQNGISANVDLINLTKISVRFYTNHTFSPGDLIELTIKIKDNEDICVKGNVVWTQTENENESNRANAVVQFLPFGSDERYNSIQSYELLAKIEEEYSKDLKIKKNIYKS